MTEFVYEALPGSRLLQQTEPSCPADNLRR
jgi:hypothetical protein